MCVYVCIICFDWYTIYVSVLQIIPCSSLQEFPDVVHLIMHRSVI